MAYTASQGPTYNSQGQERRKQPRRYSFSNSSPSQSANDQAAGWRVEPAVGRVANGVPNRVDRLRALGNAVVPQVAEWIGRRIVEVEEAAPCPA
jgi:DNA (cytosine-5)-methyltransferase 1